MKRVIIDLPDGYDKILSITAIGASPTVINVASYNLGVYDGAHIRLCKTGKVLDNGFPKMEFREVDKYKAPVKLKERKNEIQKKTDSY